ncbi:MAG: valine--tRNA ligase [Gammaproteobacteria bacterium]|nr:valine--tRNA ligase [Gammaproteobacteria bacterium]
MELTHLPHQPLFSTLATTYLPENIEKKWRLHWEESGYFKAGVLGSGQPQAGIPAFCIQLPPPNVTGTLHMGHAFNQTVMDSLTRYHRMRGLNTLWLPGTDHAGIATQIVVERQLAEKGLHKLALNADEGLARAQFIDLVWQWKQRSGKIITQQMRYLGCSVDWSKEYFTMDDNLSKVVIETFVSLYQDGLIYRGKRLVNWDPVLQTAVSDLEVENIPSQGFLYYICYPFVDGPQLIDGKLEKGMVIATTRPETMLADGALAVHPHDSRYRHLVGKSVDLPLCARQIPIIADEFVDQGFGTGCVKITGAHDFNDYACSQRHQLPLITIFDKQARLNEHAPLAYQGLDRIKARLAVVADLKTAGLLLKAQEHSMALPICTRTQQVVEPMLTDQWFVATRKVAKSNPSGRSLAEQAYQAVESGEIRIFPETWLSTYQQWLENIQDWCISRQLWWGHQIPAWYDEEGQVYVAHNEQEARSLANGRHLVRDPDVLDTWYSSALVPFSTLGWQLGKQSSEMSDLSLYLPSSVLVTGYDILFFWVARMVMMTKHFTGKVPFKDVYVHGLVRDAQGKKMSKSEGNVLDPVDLIEGISLPELLDKRTHNLRLPEMAPTIRRLTELEFPQGIPAYGADSLRMTFAMQATLGRAIHFDSKQCTGYKNFCNKLWQASRFVVKNCEGFDCGLKEHSKAECAPGGSAFGYLQFSMFDRWLVSILQQVELEVEKAFSQYRLDLVATQIYQFVWNEFCDWYLEIAKVQLNSGNESEQRATRRTLLRVLETILRLSHPIIPFITEELWQQVAILSERKNTDSIGIAPYPQSQPHKIDWDSIHFVKQFKELVDNSRNLRSQLGLSPATKAELLVYVKNPVDVARITPSYQLVFKALAKLTQIEITADETIWQDKSERFPHVLVGNLALCLMVQSHHDLRSFLQKDINKLQEEITRIEKIVNNPQFALRAPKELVEKEQLRYELCKEKYTQLMAQLEKHGK